MDGIISDPISDETASGSAGGASSDAAGSSPAPGTITPEPGASSGGDDTAQSLADDQPPVNPIAELLKELPTAEELKQQADQGQKYAMALSTFRPIVEAHEAQSKQFEPWKTVMDQYRDPALLQSSLEIVSELLKDQVVDGKTVPNTAGVVAMLDAKSPSRADSLMVDMLQSKVNYNGVEDTRLNHVSRQLFGKSVQEVMSSLKKLETRPAPTAIDRAELDQVDPKYHAIWGKLASETKDWLLNENTSETARNDYLSRALSDEQRAESDRTREESDAKAKMENETKFFNEAKAEGRKAVDQGLGELLGSILENTFKDVSNDTVTLTGSKETDNGLRGLVGAALVALTDPVKRPYVEKLLGVTLDPELDKQSSAYETALTASVIATKYGDQMSASQRAMEAENARQWIIAKGNDIGATLLTYLSGILGQSNENRGTALARATAGRATISGSPINPAGNGNAPRTLPGQLGSEERRAALIAPFVRS